MGEPTRNIRNYEQDHIGYLNLIQGNISRMAGNSALMKGFAATVMASMLGMCVAEMVTWYYIAIAIIPLLAFIRLDIFYLQLEKKYRNLYVLIAEKAIDDPHYALDLKSPALQKHKKKINKGAGFFKTLCSVSVWQFYIWFIALAVTLIIFIA